MKNDIKTWLRQWDEGNFDFTEAAAGPMHKTITTPEERDHPWKHEPVTRVEEREKQIFSSLYPIFALILSLVLIMFLFRCVEYMPPFGGADNPAVNEVVERYVEHGTEETGAVNTVAGMILDYRAFDTLGESHVLYTAATTVFILLLNVETGGEYAEDRKITANDPVLCQTVRFIVPLVLIFGFYVILCGHLGPGGGFSGGSIIGGGLILYAVTFGFENLEKIINIKSYRAVVLIALCFYSLAKCYSFFCGANGLETVFSPGVPGRIFSAGLILPLNVAVGIVVSMTMYGFYSVFTRGKI